MGAVFRKQTTRKTPAGAEFFTRNGQRLARWKDARGKSRTAPVRTGRDGLERIITTAGTWTAKFRDGQGIVREVATGCRDKQAALSVLAELERRAELVKANVITVMEDAIADHQPTPIARHIDDYMLHLESRQTSKHHRTNVRGCLRRIIADCGFVRLADLNAEPVERWMLAAEKDGMGARTRNRHLSAVSAFANWCVESNRLAGNPFERVAKANENADRRRQRRAMSEEELCRLLDAARSRPLRDAMTVRTGKRKGQLVAKVRSEVRQQLERLGRERALIYKTLVLTGLRRGELASLTIAQCHLAGPTPYLDLAAGDEKNGDGSQIPLRDDLAADLREWINSHKRSAEEPAVLSIDSARAAASILDERLFDVPRGLIRILDRDLDAAGIPKVDERGRTLDVHALRHTFGTLLSKGGVAPRTAQAAMRHSDIDLTMGVYTDPKLLDVQGALNSLPALPLDSQPNDERLRATGTDDEPAGSLVAPTVAPNQVQPGHSGSSADNPDSAQDDDDDPTSLAVTSAPVKKKARQSSTDDRAIAERVTGLEPATFSLGS